MTTYRPHVRLLIPADVTGSFADVLAAADELNASFADKRFSAPRDRDGADAACAAAANAIWRTKYGACLVACCEAV